MLIKKTKSVWIEITSDEHQHGGKGWGYGESLWSPTVSDSNRRIYDLMLQPQIGDLVLHFLKSSGNRYYDGFSYVDKACVTTTKAPPIPGDWGGREEYFKIELKNFTQLEDPLNLNVIKQDFLTVIKNEIHQDKPKYYPFDKNVKLKQGLYLTSCSDKLFYLLQVCSNIEVSEEMKGSTQDPLDNSFLDGEETSKETEIKDFVPRKPPKKRVKGKGKERGKNLGQRKQPKDASRIGKIGEEIIFKYEKEKLIKEGRKDLSDKVIWCRDDKKNRTPGYDILSYDKNGNEKFIEVKSSTGKTISSVNLTPHEWEVAQECEKKKDYFIYLVSEVLTKHKIEILRDPYQKVLDGLLRPISISEYELFLYSNKLFLYSNK